MAQKTVSVRLSVEADNLDGIRKKLEELGATVKTVGNDNSADKLRRSLEGLEGRLDPAARAAQRLARDTETLNKSLAEGAVSQERYNVLLARAQQANAQAAAGMTSAAGAAGSFRGVMGNLGAQIQDVTVQAQMGTSAFIILAQQGPQIASAFGPVGAAIGAVIAIASVAASAVYGMSASADAAKTAFADYATAMDVAVKAAAAMQGASVNTRAALEAERRSVIAARQEVLKKAEADLVAAQAADASARNDLGARRALGAGTLDDVVEQRRKRVSDLRKELLVLQGSYGEFSDGARQAVIETERSGKVTTDYAGNIRNLNEDLRNQITELGFQVEAQDLSSAAKLRAKLQSDAMAKSGVAEYSAVNAGTRALIDQAVAQQENIDKMQDDEKASNKAASAAESLAKSRAKLIGELDRDIDAQKRLAEIAGMGAAEQRAANEQTRIAAELAKARTTESTAEGKAIAAKVKEAERWKAVAADTATLSAAKANLKYAQDELALANLLPGVRERAVRSLQIQREATVRWGAATSDVKARWIDLQEQIADTQAIKKFEDEVRSTAKDISKDISESLYDRLMDPSKATSVVDVFKSIFKRIGVAALEANIVLPITQQIVGAAPGLFGISGSTASPLTGQAANQNSANQNGGFNLNNLNINGVGGGLLDKVGLGFMTQPLVPGGFNPASGGIDAAMNLGMDNSSMFTGIGGNASALGVLGTGASLLNFAMNPSIGSGVGAAGSLMSLLAPAGSVLGPIGMGLAIAAPLLEGLFGKDRGKPAAAAHVEYNGTKLIGGDRATDNEGDAAQAQQIYDSLNAATAKFMLASGATTPVGGIGIGVEAKEGKYRAYTNNGDAGSFDTLDEAVIAQFRKNISDGLISASDDVLKAVANSTATDINEFMSDVSFAKGFKSQFESMNAALDPTNNQIKTYTETAQALGEQVKSSILDWKDSAQELGLATEDQLATAAKRGITALMGLGPAVEPLRGLEAVTKQATIQFEAFSPALSALGYTASEVADLAAQYTAKLVKTRDDALALTKAQGNTAIEQLVDPLAKVSINARLTGLGLDPTNSVIAGLASVIGGVEASARAGTLSITDERDALAALDRQLDAGYLTADQYGAAISYLTQAWQDSTTAADAAASATKQAAEAAASAQQARLKALTDEASRLGQVKTQWAGVADKLSAARVSVALGEYSPLNPDQQLGVARRQWTETLAKAQAGDLSAAEALQAVGEAWLKADRAVNATANPDAYYAVQAGLSSVETVAQRQLGLAQTQLAELQRHTVALNALVNASTARAEASLLAPGETSSVLGLSYGNSTVRQERSWLRDLGFDGLFGGGRAQSWIDQVGLRSAYQAQFGLGGFATGTPSAPPGWAWVGERGPELMPFQGGEPVIPNAAAVSMAARWEQAAALPANDRWPGVAEHRLARTGGTSSRDAADEARQLRAEVARLHRTVDRMAAMLGDQNARQIEVQEDIAESSRMAAVGGKRKVV